jgi:large repetitive protein
MLAGGSTVMLLSASAKALAASDDLIPDEYIVVLKPGGARNVARTFSLAAREGARVHHTYTHALEGFAASMSSAAAARLAADPSVAYVEQSVVFQGDDRTVQSAPPWNLDRIDRRPLRLDDAYAYGSDGRGVTVYVLDTGIAYTHPEFEGRASQLGGSFAPPPGPGCSLPADPPHVDTYGHGTHVAGVIGSKTYGVAKGVTLKAVRVLDACNTGDVASVLAGIDAMIADHLASGAPSVANMSLSANVRIQSVLDAVDAAVASGITLTVAAGNGEQISPVDRVPSDACGVTPAAAPAAPAALTVGAVDAMDHEASFSKYGPCVSRNRIVLNDGNLTTRNRLLFMHRSR